MDPMHSTTAEVTPNQTASDAAAAAAAPTPPPSELHDQLRVAFEGDAANRLEELGVSAFDSSEVERNILNEAIADDEKQQATAEAARAAAGVTSASTNAIPPRRIIKKKSAAQLEKERERESFVPLPVPKARERIVHPNEGKHAAASKGFRSSSKSKFGSSASGLGLSRARAGDGESVIERAAQSGTLRDGEEARLERQRAIEHGEATPFANVGGLSKDFARVHTQRILPPGGALMPRPPVPIAAAAAASARQPTVSVSQYSSPFPRAQSLSQAPRSSPAKVKSATKPALPRAKTAASASASPTPAARSKQKRPVKRAKREATSSSSDASDDDFTPRIKKEKKAVQPWACPACSYINPSDFSRRCDICHTVRTKSAAELAPPPAAAASSSAAAAPSSPVVKLEPGSASAREYIELSSDADSAGAEMTKPAKPSRKRKVKSEPGLEDADSEAADDAVKEEEEEEEWKGDQESSNSSSSSSSDEDDDVDAALKDEDALVDDDDDDIDDDELAAEAVAAASSHSKHRHRRSRHNILHDDYEDWSYEERVDAWRAHRENELQYAAEIAAANPAAAPPADENLDVAFDGGFILPAYIWNKLFAYQKTCIKWLWELHAQGCGGIIADEMGLGKTIQVLAFLAGLHYSAQHATLNPSGSSSSSASASSFRSLGPTLIVVPATIMSQWLREFQEWYPEMRVVVLHDSVPHDARVSRKQLVDRVFQAAAEGQGTVLITTYQSIHGNKHLLLPREWGYVILDEGHKIRNPDAAVTLLCKQFLSVHRLILTGSPISNHLTELWSLFDFVFPGKLGTLPVFEDEFASPILNGGYTSATPVQIQLAYKCALILRDLINPYVLRRSKVDVAQHLPPKTEQVLFCNLTPDQHAIYQQYLDQNARDIADIVKGKMSLFRVIHYLRKIANHPDLLQLKVQRKTVDQNGRVVAGKTARQRRLEEEEDDRMLDHPLLPDYGSVNRSGKMQVVQQVLRMWKTQGHRCLLFSQTRQMLDILEKFVRGEGYNYRRVDGSTSIKTRMPIIDEFNKDPNIFIMLITTRAGGLGVNLVGADRVILYDPDWNPQSDMQAKERAYRIGQSRSVTVYRLITRGCIEEKVYHRQIWKQFLTDKVLKDPKQKRFFSNHDIKDLFSLAPLTSKKGAAPLANETGAIFQEGVIKAKDVIEADAEERRREIEALRPAPTAPAAAAVSSAAAARSSVAASPVAPVVVKSEPLEDGEVTMEDVAAAAESKDNSAAAAASSTAAAAPTPRDRFFTGAPADSPVKSHKSQMKQEQTEAEDAMPDVTFPPLEIEDYASDHEGPTRERDDHAQSTADDNRILAALFSKSGLQSAMNHDVILNSSSQEEKHLVASLAQKVADRAVAALKASRQKMKDQPVNAPTWTGRSGTSGAPSFVTGSSPQSSPPPAAAPKPKFGASSRKPALFSAASAAKEGNVLTDAAVHEGKLRAASFGGQNGGGASAVAAAVSSSSSASSEARHFDSSISGFAVTSTTAPASLAHKVLNTGGASSSALLLQRMRNRSHVSSVMASHTGMPDATLMELDGTAGATRSVLSGEPSPADKSAHLLSSLRALLLSRPDGVSSDELISTFGASIGSGESDKLVFRQMLRRVAELHGKKKHARWKIKPEFD